MQKAIVVLALFLTACGTRPAAVVPADGVRPAIDIRYVGVPSMNIYTEPNNAAPVVTTYGYTETVSILARRGEWVEVRTVDGSGWAHTAELIGSAQVEQILKDPSPRFLTAPVSIPQPRARGEIVIQAKVNTDGDVIDVRTVRNTTGSPELASAIAASLQQAKFYPMVQKGQRMWFTYDYAVLY